MAFEEGKSSLPLENNLLLKIERQYLNLFDS